MERFVFRPRVVPLPELARASSARASRPGGDVAWDAFRRLAARRDPVFLDSAGGTPARFDLIGFDPLPDPEAQHGDAARSREEAWGREGVRGLGALLERLVPEQGDGLPDGCPFAGGFLGALAYELGPGDERLALPADPWSENGADRDAEAAANGRGGPAHMPRVLGGLYVDFLVVDRLREESYLVLAEDPGDGRAPWQERRDAILAALRAPAPALAFRADGPLHRHIPAAEHRARVERVRAAIERGEIYQANLVQRFTRPVTGDPLGYYARLRRAHPAPYMGFVRSAGRAVLSASMELLLELGRDGGGRYARTRPIKGTIARGASPGLDRDAAARLLASEKDLAELAMIVDLERNDLGRIARAGSVAVPDFPTLESYATVHHLVADVRARPRPEADACEVLASLFPGGSITGAPKLRAMEILADIEGEGRGFSFGSMGFLDLAGRACFNLLIRSPLWRARPDLAPDAGEVTYRVGGGITWASDPAGEDRESLLKGMALAEALER